MLSVKQGGIFFEFLVWHDLGLNPISQIIAEVSTRELLKKCN